MQDGLSAAISEALEPVQHLEKDWDRSKLTKRIRDYFRKAGKSLDFREKSWLVLVNEYADSVFSSIFQAIGDRPWLDQVDFILVLDAGIKEFFPGHVTRDVPSEEFQQGVLAAHDRAFEEQRFLPKIWAATEHLGITGKARKRALDSIDEGRKVALKLMRDPASPDEAKAFVSRWVDSALQRLTQCTQGDPEAVLDEQQATEMFTLLLQGDAMPVVLTAEHGSPPKEWPFVPFAVHAAWAVHTASERLDARMRGPGLGAERHERSLGAPMSPSPAFAPAFAPPLLAPVPAFAVPALPGPRDPAPRVVPAKYPGLPPHEFSKAAAPFAKRPLGLPKQELKHELKQELEPSGYVPGIRPVIDMPFARFPGALALGVPALPGLAPGVTWEAERHSDRAFRP
ncbi:unnamed protein product [Effrenium voratum]|nr:unnamed protein product [Effrenium voratum]